MKTMPYNLASSTTPSVQTALQQSKALSGVYDQRSIALTTGKKVNTSYDNSTLFFKDVRLSEKAQELNSVLDGLTNVVSALSTAGKSLDSISSMLEQARAAANSAMDAGKVQTKLTGSGYTVERDTVISDMPSINDGDEFLIRTGDADKFESDYVIKEKMTLDDLNIVRGEELKIKIGDDDWISLTVFDENMTVSDFLGQISVQDECGNFEVDITNQKLTLSTKNQTPILLQGSVAEAMGFDLTSTHKITIGNDWTAARLVQEISAFDDIEAQINKDGNLEITSLSGDELIIGDLTGKTADTFGLTGYDDSSTYAMKAYADQYNEILKQIDNVVNDSSYNGLNLLKGDAVRAFFDERRENVRMVHGIKTDSASLGLSEAVGNWERKEDVQKALDDIENAFYQTRNASHRFELASGLISSRTSFLTDMANACQINAQNLTGADLNETAVELLATETQKELVNNVISITMDTNASLLSLF